MLHCTLAGSQKGMLPVAVALVGTGCKSCVLLFLSELFPQKRAQILQWPSSRKGVPFDDAVPTAPVSFGANDLLCCRGTLATATLGAAWQASTNQTASEKNVPEPISLAWLTLVASVPLLLLLLPAGVFTRAVSSVAAAPSAMSRVQHGDEVETGMVRMVM